MASMQVITWALLEKYKGGGMSLFISKELMYSEINYLKLASDYIVKPITRIINLFFCQWLFPK